MHTRLTSPSFLLSLSLSVYPTITHVRDEFMRRETNRACKRITNIKLDVFGAGCVLCISIFAASGLIKVNRGGHRFAVTR